MNFKVFAAIFVGFLAINVSVQSPTLKDDSIKTIVIEVLNQILSTGKIHLDDANAVLDSIENDPEGFKNRVVDAAVKIGIQVNTDILALIDRLRDKATDDGKAVLDCIDAEQSKVEANIAQVFGDIGDCLVGENPKVIAELRVILGQLTDLNTDLQGQSDTLAACSDSETTCLLGFAGTILGTVQKIPAAVQTDVQAIIGLIRTIVGDVSGCADNVIASIGDNIQEIFDEAVVCIKK